jgi:hypothetical protein
MTSKLEDALARYIDARRVSKQREIEKSLREAYNSECRRRFCAEQISEMEQKSRDFLSSRLRELSR